MIEEQKKSAERSDEDSVSELTKKCKKKRGKKSASILNYTWLSITKFHAVKTEAEIIAEKL